MSKLEPKSESDVDVSEEEEEKNSVVALKPNPTSNSIKTTKEVGLKSSGSKTLDFSLPGKF
jgi:hypothetical protein